MLPKTIYKLLTILLFVPTLIKSQNRYNYEVEKLPNDVFLLKPNIHSSRWVTSNIVVIVNKNDVLVVDSGLLPSAAEEAISVIKKITSKPVKYLVNTHWHGDHWQGNIAFQKMYPGIKIITSKKNQSAILRNGNAWLNIYYPRYLNMMLLDAKKDLTRKKEGKDSSLMNISEDQLLTGISELEKDIDEIKSLNGCYPNTTFDKKMIINTDNRIIELHYLGIGNTIGDVIVYLPKEKYLITGDLVVFPSPFESGAFSKDWVETSKKLASDFTIHKILPGHGPVLHDASYLEFLNALYVELIKQMENAYRSGYGQVSEAINVVTLQTISASLEKNENHRKYLKNLGADFIRGAIRSSFLSMVNGRFE